MGRSQRRSGGAAASGGIEFQHRVAAWLGVRVLGEAGFSPGPEDLDFALDVEALAEAVAEVVAEVHARIEPARLRENDHDRKVPRAKALAHGLLVGRGRSLDPGGMRTQHEACQG